MGIYVTENQTIEDIMIRWKLIMECGLSEEK